MKQDPHYAQEQEKYANPIPSREFILTTLTEFGAPMSREQFFQHFQLDDSERQEALRRRLRAMEKAGQLVFTSKRRYANLEMIDALKGTVIGHRDGYGFLHVEGADEDYFLPNTEMNGLLSGDVVLAQANGRDHRGRKKAHVLSLLAPRQKAIVGRYFTEQGQGFVVPDDNRLTQDIFIAPESRKGARMGQVVVVQLAPRVSRFDPICGEITEILGDSLSAGMEVEIAIRNHDIPHQWPEKALKQANQFDETVRDYTPRRDLRDLPLITIDGESARDFDDAVYCQPEGDGWRLWVAIADVSYYVRPKTALDLEAQARGNSVYFPNRVVPMLPEVLSNGLCSLNPQVDRLCLVAEMQISAQGKLTHYAFYDAVMNSKARMTYNKVWKILQGDEALSARYEAVVPHIQHLNGLYQTLCRARQARGAIEFETLEPQFIFNADGRIERIETLTRNDAHKLIEECMILANIAAARFVEAHNEPALFRIHDKPSDEKLSSFRQFLRECGLSLEGGLTPSTQDYAALLSQIGQRPDRELIQSMLLRSLKQAVYSPDNIGHFGLALSHYAHFTSPIRRYPDLLLHRAIKYILAKQQGNTRPYSENGGFHYALNEMDDFAERCSGTERRADEATREVIDWLKCEFMQDQVGERFEGIITNVTHFGFFVKLNELMIDGLVHISSLSGHFEADLARQCLYNSAGTRYKLGDPVSILVQAVHLDSRKIDFVLLNSLKTPKRASKKGKNSEKPQFRELSTQKAKGQKKASSKAKPSKARKPKKAKKNGYEADHAPAPRAKKANARRKKS